MVHTSTVKQCHPMRSVSVVGVFTTRWPCAVHIIFFTQVEAEENIPVSFDIHHILDLAEAERRPFLDNLLRGCPATEEVPAFVEKYVGHIEGLNPYL